MAETPLEKLIATMCDPTGLTDAEVREELAEQGIDLDAEMAKFRPKLDELMRARAVRLALAAVRDNLPDPESPLPWRVDKDDDELLRGSRTDTLRIAEVIRPQDMRCIIARVTFAPVLAAEVERSRGNLLTQAKRAGLPVEQLQATDLAEHLADRVLELEAQRAAARVAVESRGHDTRCNAFADNAADCGCGYRKARRAVGLEG